MAQANHRGGGGDYGARLGGLDNYCMVSLSEVSCGHA